MVAGLENTNFNKANLTKKKFPVNDYIYWDLRNGRRNHRNRIRNWLKIVCFSLPQNALQKKKKRKKTTEGGSFPTFCKC